MSRYLQYPVQIHKSRINIPLVWTALFAGLTAASGWSLASEVFVSAEFRTRFLVSGAALISFLVALAVHELAHWLWARNRYVFARYLTLHWFGSLPSSYYTPEKPEMEARHAAIGPVASGVVGSGFLGLAVIVGIETVAGRLATGFAALNLGIGAINLIPAFPFDGGRILRAVFWYLNDRHVSGSRVAFLYSQLVASCCLGFGVFLLAWRESAMLVGIWLVALSWMCVRTSRSELLRANLIERAGRVRASDAVHGLNPTIRARASISEAVDILLEQKENGPALVRDRNRYIGMLTLDEVQQVPRTEWPNRLVLDVMKPIDGLVNTDPDAPLIEVLRTQHHTAPLPVIVRSGNGSITGLIDNEMAPRLLLRRAEERTFDLAGPRTDPEISDRS